MSKAATKLMALLLVLIIFTMDLCAFAGTSKTLALPSDLKYIKEEAFYGDTSIDKVTLSDHVQEIHSRAFAYSTLTEINLPASISYIAEDAFTGSALTTVTATEGTYAWEWAVAHGYIYKLPEIWSSTPTSFTPSGGTNPKLGKLIDSSYYGKLLSINAKGGGWFILEAPEDGYYTFEVLNDNTTSDWAEIWGYIYEGSSTRCVNSLKCLSNSTKPVQMNTIDLTSGERYYFWVPKNGIGSPSFAYPLKTVITFTAESVAEPTAAPTATPGYEPEGTLPPKVTPTPVVTATPGSNPQPSDLPTPTPAPTATPGHSSEGTPPPKVTPTPVPDGLGIPTNVKATANTDGSILVTWTKTTGGDGYIVKYRVDGDIVSTLQHVDGINSESCTIPADNLTKGETYIIVVCASIGTGPFDDVYEEGDESDSVEVWVPDGNSSVLSGSFGQNNYVVEIDGKALQLTGSVSCSGSTINRITVNVKGISDTNYEQLMTCSFDNGPTYIDLEDYAAFQPDTSAYPFNTPGTYTLQLWASAADGTPVKSPLATATLTVIKFNAKFNQTSKTIVLGDKWILSGNVSVEGSTLGKVTVNTHITSDVSLWDDFSDHYVSTINLQNWAAYTIDTSQAPFNQVGTYTFHIWAKDVNGVGGSHWLDEMTVNVVEELDYTTEVQRINDLIVSTYATVRANDPNVNDGQGYGCYGGTYLCGRFVGRQAIELGFVYKNANGQTYTSIGYPNGNDWYSVLGHNQIITNTKDGLQYIQKKYAGSNCLQDLIAANGGGNIYNIIISYERWTDSSHTSYTADGHVRYIYAILKDPSTDKYMVYFTDNMISKNGVPEGEMVSTDLEDFSGAWIERNRYVPIGAIHFQPTN